MKTAILWFRQDLRLGDNPALRAALQQARQVVPVYIHNDTESGNWSPGSASRWWLHHSLSSLSADIRAHGSRLILRQGPSVAALLQLVEETGASEIFCNALYEPAHSQRDEAVARALAGRNIGFHLCHGNLLRAPETIRNLSGEPYRVFTPFYRCYLKAGFDIRVVSRPKRLPPVPGRIRSERLATLALSPSIPWYKSIASHWQPGEQGATTLLQQFNRHHLDCYSANRDLPATSGTTRLSPHLHFGEVSPRQIIAATDKVVATSTQAGLIRAREALVRQLVWRDFAHHVLVHFPHTAEKPFNRSYAGFPWKRSNRRFMTAWGQGNTGIPIVDAGMRELWHTGWMHNRVRMIVASLLTKNANVSWLNGARWFWDTLVDANLANNSMNWQWVAGCGVDAAPYFRIFNPVTQSRKFDPQGVYLRRWIPELDAVPDRYIHDPWTAPAAVQQQAGITIGKDYPLPILDIGKTRRQVLEQFRNWRPARR